MLICALVAAGCGAALVAIGAVRIQAASLIHVGRRTCDCHVCESGSFIQSADISSWASDGFGYQCY